MVVLGRHDDQPIRADDGVAIFGEAIFDGLAIVVTGKLKVAYIEQFCFNIAALIHSVVHEPGDVCALVGSAIGAEDERDKYWFVHMVMKYS